MSLTCHELLSCTATKQAFHKQKNAATAITLWQLEMEIYGKADCNMNNCMYFQNTLPGINISLLITHDLGSIYYPGTEHGAGSSSIWLETKWLQHQEQWTGEVPDRLLISNATPLL